jgi:hypothetical protein
MSREKLHNCFMGFTGVLILVLAPVNLQAQAAGVNKGHIQQNSENQPNRPLRPGSSGKNLPSTSVELFGANRNGNPGFPYAVSLGGRAFAKCQATLISADSGLCIAATAAHCLEDKVREKRQEQDVCPITGKPVKMLRGQAVIEMADFGSVTASVFVNPEYSEGSKSEDSALFTWPCEGARAMPVVSISNKPLEVSEQIFYGKVMNGKEGLYPGYVWRAPRVTTVFGRKVGEATETILQHSGVEIEQGDSGGGAYRKQDNGKFELVGVLSTSGDARNKRPLGNYSVNKSLDFLRCMKSKLAKDSGRFAKP